MTPVTQIVGRRPELAGLQRLLDSAAAGPQTLVIEGEAGIGKTTIWSELIAAARRREMTVLSCRCVESELGLPFTSLADLLDTLPGGLRGGLPEPQRKALDVALLQTEPGEAPPDPRALGTALLGLLRAAVAAGPLLVAVDDPPWMDASSARAVGFALRRLSDLPVTLVLARRLPEVSGGLDVAVGDPDQLRRLPLGPLAVPELRTLLRRRTEQRVGHPEAERIHLACGGNPYFALEVARNSPELASVPAGRVGPLPDSLRALVGQRVESEPAHVRAALLLAAAASRPTRPLLEAVTDQSTRAGLDQALERQLLVGKGELVEFAHPLLADAAYWDATDHERRLAHRRLADTVREQEEQARHAALATSGADAAVATTLDTAARHALVRGAPEHAAELLEMAARLSPATDAADRARRVHAAAHARFLGGDGRGASALLERLLDSAPEGPGRAAVLSAMARIRYHDETLAAAIELLQEALPQAEEDAVLQVSIRRDLAWALASIGDVRSAEPHARVAVRLLPASASPELTASVWSVSSVVGFLAGRGADLDLLERAQQVQPSTTLLSAFDAVLCRAQVLKWIDRFAASRADYIARSRKLVSAGEEGSLAFVYFQHGELECWAGQWDDAAKLSQLGIEAAELADQRSHVALNTYVSGLVHAFRGEVPAAREAFGRAQELGEQAPSIQAWVHTGLGFLELSLGDATAAHRHLAPFADMAALTGLREQGVFRFLPDLVDCLLLLGDVVAAAPMASALEDQGLALDRPYALVTGARCVGQVAAASGSWDEAVAAFDRALVAHDRLDQPFELARTRLAHGVVLRRLKRRAAARSELEQALAGFDRLGARLWSERAQGELARAGGIAKDTDLTPTEARVADLVSGGRSNREVAAALNLSVKTVETNLTRVYRKLGVRSRTGLALIWGRAPA